MAKIPEASNYEDASDHAHRMSRRDSEAAQRLARCLKAAKPAKIFRGMLLLLIAGGRGVTKSTTSEGVITWTINI